MVLCVENTNDLYTPKSVSTKKKIQQSSDTEATHKIRQAYGPNITAREAEECREAPGSWGRNSGLCIRVYC